MWRIIVNIACAGHRRCVGISPQRFALNDDDQAFPRSEVIEPDEAVLRAVAACPMAAIEVTDMESGQPQRLD